MKIKKYILTVVIVILLLIIGILIAINYGKENQEKNENEEFQMQNVQKEETEIKEVTNSAMYFTVKSCIDKYMNYLSEENKEAIYNVLSLSYIEKNDVNIDNVLNKIEKIEGKKLDLNIQEMKVKNDGEDFQTYYIYGKIRNENNSNSKILLTVNVDVINKTFSIEPEVIEGVFDE